VDCGIHIFQTAILSEANREGNEVRTKLVEMTIIWQKTKKILHSEGQSANETQVWSN